VIRALVAGALLLGCSRGSRPTDADCDRAAARAAKLMDSGFAEQEALVAAELAKLCKDPKQRWTTSQVECVLAAKTAAAYKQCD
jgi:hypothetical protein